MDSFESELDRLIERYLDSGELKGDIIATLESRAEALQEEEDE